MGTKNSEILGWIENLLLIALRMGDKHRRPERYSGAEDDIGKQVGIACRELDELGCPWSVQNRALCYINDSDRSHVWQDLHRRQLREIAAEIVGHPAPPLS